MERDLSEKDLAFARTVLQDAPNGPKPVSDDSVDEQTDFMWIKNSPIVD